jgi:translation initiation factor 5A
MSLIDSREVDAYLTPVQISHVKVGKYLMIKGHPCKITSLLLSKPGKHGSCKANVTGLCQHCNKKFNMAGLPGHSNGQAPDISKLEVELIACEDFVFTLMDDGGETYDEMEIDVNNSNHVTLTDHYDEAQSKNKRCIVCLLRMPVELFKGKPSIYETLEFARLED